MAVDRVDTESGGRRTFYMAVTVVALIVAVYLALQVVGALIQLGLLLAAVVIALITYRAWRRRM